MFGSNLEHRIKVSPLSVNTGVMNMHNEYITASVVLSTASRSARAVTVIAGLFGSPFQVQPTHSFSKVVWLACDWTGRWADIGTITSPQGECHTYFTWWQYQHFPPLCRWAEKCQVSKQASALKYHTRAARVVLPFSAGSELTWKQPDIIGIMFEKTHHMLNIRSAMMTHSLSHAACGQKSKVLEMRTRDYIVE